MGMFDGISKIFSGKKQEKEDEANQVVEAPTSITNLKVGGYVEFPLIFKPEFLGEMISEKTFEITSHMKLRLNNKSTISFAEMDHGEFYIAKNKNKLEIIKFFEHNEDVINAANIDELDPILQLDDDEIVELSDGTVVIQSNEKHFHMESELGLLVEGQYSVQQHLVDCFLDSDEIRYIKAKSISDNVFMLIFVKMGGEIIIAQSTTIPLDDIQFI